MKDIRWQQRFSNYLKAFEALKDAVELSNTRKLTPLERQGLIQGFEFTHELAWNVFKDYLENQGFTNLIGSRDATRLAFKNDLIQSGDDWMKMIESRNLTSHAYNLAIAEAVAADILNKFFPAFFEMSEKFKGIRDQETSNK